MVCHSVFVVHTDVPYSVYSVFGQKVSQIWHASKSMQQKFIKRCVSGKCQRNELTEWKSLTKNIDPKCGTDGRSIRLKSVKVPMDTVCVVCISFSPSTMISQCQSLLHHYFLHKIQHLFCYEEEKNNINNCAWVAKKFKSKDFTHNFCIQFRFTPWNKVYNAIYPLCAGRHKTVPIGISCLVLFCLIKQIRVHTMHILHNRPWLSETKRNWWNCINSWPNIFTFTFQMYSGCMWWIKWSHIWVLYRQ